METRKAYWYSIIKYIADFTKGEPLNVGLLMESQEENNLQYILLDETNLKLKAIFESSIQQTTYKYGKDYFEYFLQKISDNSYPTDALARTNGILSYLNSENELPKGFYLSEPQFAKTSSPKELFLNLEVSYIGEKFINQVHGSRELIVKERANSIFANADLIDKKIKANIKINPSPSIPFKYRIDFAYRASDKIDLIQAAPGNIELLPGWLEKMNLISTKYNKANKISLLYDSSVDKELLRDTKSVIRLLKENDNKINAIDLDSTKNGIQSFVKEITEKAFAVDKLDELIA